jgi:hypothetical protein
LLKLYLEWILFSESAAHIQMGHFQVNAQSFKKNKVILSSYMILTLILVSYSGFITWVDMGLNERY